MQFNNTSSKELGLYQDALSRATADSNSFTIADFTRWANVWYYNAVIEAWGASDTWRFDDLNQTGSNDDDAGKPVAISNLIASQRTYALPTNALRIRGVSVFDNGGNYHKLDPLTEDLFTVDERELAKTDGLPNSYLLEGNNLRLFPAPASGSVTLTSGLTIYFDRELDEFTVSDTTMEPGIPEPFHSILSVGAAMDFCMSKGTGDLLSKIPVLQNRLNGLFSALRDFFSSRQDDVRSRVVPHRESYL